jgi:hypothetical protein
MMIMDRRLAGILTMVVILSTVISIVLFNFGPEELIQVLVNKYPDEIMRGGYGRPRFILDLVSTTSLPDVLVEYSILVKTDPLLVRPWNQTDATELEMDELTDNIPLLSETISRFDRCARQGLDLPIEFRGEVIEYNGSRANIYIYDFTDAYMALGLGLGQLNTTDTVWVIIVDDLGRVNTYSGIRDFFFDRLGIIYSFEIGDGKGTESFASPRMPPELRGKSPDLGMAPLFGTIHRRDVGKGDRIHILFEIMAERIFPNEGFIQLIEISVGNMDKILINQIG